jgi:isohexenylglutaconyl-CoA hydratase
MTEPSLSTLELSVQPPFARLTLNRPDVKNAMNRQMILDLRESFLALRQRADVRAVVISGAGGTFCAGGDLREMREAFTNSATDPDSQSQIFDEVLQLAQHAPQVIIARVEGAAMGGGLGLVAVSDIAIASTEAQFALPEVRLGLVPALIAPYVIRRVGLSNARRLMLTGMRFDGKAAHQFGLVHEVCFPLELDKRIDAVLEDIRQCSPEALAACKRLIFEVAGKADDETLALRADLIDRLRQSADGQEGMKAFIEKRPPHWSQAGLNAGEDSP